MTRYVYHVLGGALYAVLFVALLTPEIASAQYFGRNKVQYDDFDFKKTETNHFDIYFYPEEDVATQDAARMAERWYFRHARTFLHHYDKKPLIFYANDADFQQTNVIEGMIGQGTGGVTEALQNRVVMPLTGIYQETDHVLGHELVHTFQYDIVQSPGGGGLRGISGVPLWLIEGMAEYLTIGRDDPHTAMWMRDAILEDELPSIEDLSNPQFFPYRFGQALMAFIGGQWGDRAVTSLFRLAAQTSVDSALQEITGLESDSLSKVWHAALRAHYVPLMEDRVLPRNVGRRVLAEDIDAGRMNIAPAVSPDGRYVAFLSERSLFNIELYLADTQTGEVIEDLTEMGGEPHFDALRFINSAGTWSPDGRRFAFVIFSEGDNEIAILDVSSQDVERRISVEGVGAIANPAWSPDGRYIAFSGIHGGISDLYLLDVETTNVRQLTNDRYADIQPEWSPDGQTIAFVTDRGPNGTNFERLEYAEMRLGFIDPSTSEIEVVVPFLGADHINPQYAPDGRSLYFLSNRAGFKDIYRLELQTGALFQVTNIATGVSGITDLSPALSVADESGLLMFSVFNDGNYTVHALTQDEAEGTPVVAEVEQFALAGLLPPALAAEDMGMVGEYLLDPTTGLPEVGPEVAQDYNPALRLTYVGPPQIGVGYSTQFGAGVAGGVSFFFSDILGNHLLGAAVQANGTFKDIGGQVVYMNREDQLNWGAQVSHTPYLTGYTSVSQGPQGTIQYNQHLRRVFFSGGNVMAQYPLSTVRRFEAQAGYQHIGFDEDVQLLLVDPATGRLVGRDEVDGASRPGLNMFSGTVAFVGDYSYFGFTSPVRGGRYRLDVGLNAGSFDYGTLLADYRRYFFFRPATFAISAYHYGRYGGGADQLNEQFYPLNVGYSMYNVRGVHGYGINSFDVDECANGGVDDCAVVERVIGSRVAVAAAELRVPLFGTKEFGLINFPYLPTELVGFFDAGLAWEGGNAPDFTFTTDRTSDNVPVFSTGAAARVNVLGYAVVEVFYAYPFQRPDKGWMLGFALLPGW